MTAADRNARRIVRDTDTALSDLDNVLAQVAVDREQLLRELRAADRRPQLALGGPIYVPGLRLRHWKWWVEDSRTGNVLTSGLAITKDGAYARRFRAYLRELCRDDNTRKRSISPILNRFRKWVP